MLPAIKQEDLLNEGIEIKVTQNDVIDMIVSEQIQKILSELETLNLKSEELIKKHNNSKVLKVKAPKGAIEIKCYQTKSECSNYSIFSIQTTERNSGKIDISRDSTRLYSSVEQNNRYEITIDGVLFEGRVSKTVSTNLSEKFISEVEEHNKNVQSFLDRFPKGIDEKAVTKLIKAQFTKQIVKSTSKDFRGQLAQSFGISI